jgi:hypothetical protein
MTKQQQRSSTMSVAGIVAAIGLGLLVHGVALAWLPAGWMLAGICVAVPAIFVSYDAFRSGK